MSNLKKISQNVQTGIHIQYGQNQSHAKQSFEKLSN